MSGIFSTIPSELYQAGLHGHGSVVPVRQTVLTGRVDSNGQANFLEAGAGLTVNLKASQVPVEVAFAAGFHKGALDYVERIVEDALAAWGLPANATSFLYIDRDPNTGLISYGFTPTAPHYGSKPPTNPEVVLNPPTGGVASASSYNSVFSPDKAFDGVTSSHTNSWHTYIGDAGGVQDPWIQYKFATSQRVIKYKIAPKPDDTSYAPKSWQLLGSNDGSEWTVIDTQTNITGWVANAYKAFEVDSPGYYAYYRLLILEDGLGNGNEYGALAEWGFTTQDLVFTTPWFDLSTMEMKFNNGGAWEPKQRVFVGEAVTDGSGVVSVVTYALQGRYDSGAFPVAATTLYTKNHNIGVDGCEITAYTRQNSTKAWQAVDHSFNASNYGGKPVVGRLTGHIGFSTYIGYGATNRPDMGNTLAFDGTTGTAHAAGEARIIVERGWGVGGGSAVTDQPSIVEMGATEVPVRQTVLDGRTDANGYANFLEAGAGLTVDIKATEKPVVLAFADGFGERGAIDYVKRITADIPAAWTLPANQTSYLYVELDPYGSVSFGVSTLAPVYQDAAPSAPASGQPWYEIPASVMRVREGELWVTNRRLFIGEAVTDASGVFSVVTYAIRGRYDSGWFQVVANANYTKSHNIGIVSPKIDSLYARRTDGSGIIDVDGYFHTGTNLVYGGQVQGMTSRTTVNVYAGNIPYWPFGSSQTIANYRVALSRGW